MPTTFLVEDARGKKVRVHKHSSGKWYILKCDKTGKGHRCYTEKSGCEVEKGRKYISFRDEDGKLKKYFFPEVKSHVCDICGHEECECDKHKHKHKHRSRPPSPVRVVIK